MGSSIPAAATEREALAELRALADHNTVNRSMIGLGYYDTITPAVIKRNVLENPSWYTAYTPYQPEISQGRLEALINFQTMVSDLTGLTTANASMLDEGTAVVEGMLLARRASDQTRTSSSSTRTRCRRPRRCSRTARRLSASSSSSSTSPTARLCRTRSASSCSTRAPPVASWDPAAVIAAVKENGGLAVVAADLLALTLLTSPGELGADVAVGTTQRFGVPMGFGGPHAGYMAVRAGLERQLPGRLVGVSQDAVGHPAYRLTLQTREQHIRREKATSNICTAQVLLAVMASMYAVYHGPEGLKRIALASSGCRRVLRRPPGCRWLRARERELLRHADGPYPGARGGDRHRGPGQRHPAASCRRRHRSAELRRGQLAAVQRGRRPRHPRSRAGLRAGRRRHRADRVAVHPGSARAHLATTSRTRCSTRTAARRR